MSRNKNCVDCHGSGNKSQLGGFQQCYCEPTVRDFGTEKRVMQEGWDWFKRDDSSWTSNPYDGDSHEGKHWNAGWLLGQHNKPRP